MPFNTSPVAGIRSAPPSSLARPHTAYVSLFLQYSQSPLFSPLDLDLGAYTQTAPTLAPPRPGPFSRPVPLEYPLL